MPAHWHGWPRRKMLLNLPLLDLPLTKSRAQQPQKRVQNGREKVDSPTSSSKLA